MIYDQKGEIVTVQYLEEKNLEVNLFNRNNRYNYEDVNV